MGPQTNECLNSLDRRLTVVEQDLAVLKATVATKDDVGKIQAEMSRLNAVVDNCATKADLAALETRITKWMIATLVTVAGMNAALVLIVARLMHV